MNVKELIKELKKLPQDLMVVINGYEGGVDEFGTIKKIRIDLNVNDEWYYGSHEESEDGAVEAVLLKGSK